MDEPTKGAPDHLQERFKRALGLSLFIHGLLGLSAVILTSSREISPQKTETLIRVELVEMKARNQVVESSLGRLADKAKPDAYLGMQNQVVDQQKRAKNSGAFRELRRGGEGSRERTREDNTPKVALNHLGVPVNFKPLGNLGPPGTKSPGQLASSSDYLPDLREGAETLLNTREYAYYSFYQRVRRQLEQFWEPNLRTRLRMMIDRGRTVAAEREHATKLCVILDSEGLITKVQIQGTSGYLDLDQAAIDAFNKAGPFPNPPKGMVERDGTVKVEWEFVVRT